jgi:acyl-CoA synthetase (AMP-forming)/AMP-acid ligase II
VHDAERAHLLITEDTDGQERSFTLTFGELYAAGQRCAAELARRGVPAGGRVALMLPTSRAFFVSYAGILLAGAIPVPIYPPFRADRIEEYAARQSAILNNAEVCLLLTFRRAEAVAKLLRPRVRSLTGVADAEKLIEAADKAPPPSPGALPLHLSGSRARKSSDLALLQYTSGSTGDPKGVMLTHANLLANIRAVGEAVQLGPGDVGVSWLPLYHDMGLIGAWLTLLHFGVPLAVMSPLAFLTRPERWLQAFHKHRGTIAAAPNFAYELCVRKIADKDIRGVDLSSWRAALNGAEPVNPETLERFANRFAGHGFRREAQLPVYGLAEASLAVTVPPLGRGPLIDRVERETFTSQGRAVPAASEDETAIAFVSSGRPIPRHEVRIVDDSGMEVAERTEGFLWFRGPSATSGYYRNVAATEAVLPLGPASEEGEYAWLNSGDRAYCAEGEIYVTGRVKDIIIKGGRNLYPHEVEELAARAEGIRKGCIVAFGLKDEASGTEKLVVVAETRERDCRRHDGIGVAGAGASAGPRGADSAGEHSENFQRKIAPRRNEAALSGGDAVCVQSAGVGSDRAAGFGKRATRFRTGLDCRREARAGDSLRVVFRRGVSAVGRADMDDGAFHQRSSRGGALYFTRAEDSVCADWMPRNRRRQGKYGPAGREDFRVESYELFRCASVDGWPGSTLPFCREDGSRTDAVHWHVFDTHGTPQIRPHRCGFSFEAGPGVGKFFAQWGICVCFSRRDVYERGWRAAVSAGSFQSCGGNGHANRAGCACRYAKDFA